MNISDADTKSITTNENFINLVLDKLSVNFGKEIL